MTDRAGTQSRLVLPASVHRDLWTWAVDSYPGEACGLLVGRIDGPSHAVRRATLARNLETERVRDRYTLAPGDWVAAETGARRDGMDVIGVWHTHPDHPATPSATDLAGAWEVYAYLILSVTCEGVVDTRSWQLRGDRFAEQSIEEPRT